MLTADWNGLPAIAACALAVAGVLALLARGLADRWAVWGRRASVRGSVLALSCASLLLLAAAATNPRWVYVPATPALHLVLVVDTSNSVLRGPGGWQAVQQQLVKRVEQTQGVLAKEPGVQVALATSLVTFAAGVEAQASGDLPGLRQALLRLAPVVGDAGSSLALGLDRAHALIAAGGGPGVVILASDGYATAGDGTGAAQRLAAAGIPIYIWPLSGGGPATAIAAAYVAQRVDAGAEIQARLMLANGVQPTGNEIMVQVNPGLPAGQRMGAAATLTQTVQLEAQQRASVRVPLRFTGAGMQLVEAGLQTAAGVQEKRRFYVQVKQPPAILALGDSQWAAALPQNVAQVTPGAAANVQGAADLTGYDAVVISGVPATEFTPAGLEALAAAVTEGGLGLFMLNGPHSGQAEDAPTVLMSYNDTAIEPLLPVSTRPRPTLQEPPPLHIVILIDTSGSMEGYKLQLAKTIAHHLIAVQMRPIDRLDLLTFTTEAWHLVVDSPMNAANKRAAFAALDALQAGGGTVIGPALDAIAGRNLGECGLIIITDLEFDVAKQRPECKSTIFAVEANAAAGSPLEAFAEPFYVDANFSPANIKLSIYNPQPRDKFFEPGQYQALSAEHGTGAANRLPVPALPLEGDAISYIVEDAELIAVRPRLTDPVLAYKRSGSGYVGAFTTGLPPAWLADAQGRQAIGAWLERVLPFIAQNRYAIQLQAADDRLLLRVELTGEGGPLPQIGGLSAVVELAGGEAINANLQADPGAPGAFTGELRLPATAGSAPDRALGFLVLTETGLEALPRPQRVPFVVPPPASAAEGLTAEDYSFGTDDAALEELAAAGSGAVLAQEPPPIVLRARSAERTLPLWPGLLVGSLAALVVAVALPRWFA